MTMDTPPAPRPVLPIRPVRHARRGNFPAHAGADLEHRRVLSGAEALARALAALASCEDRSIDERPR